MGVFYATTSDNEDLGSGSDWEMNLRHTYVDPDTGDTVTDNEYLTGDSYLRSLTSIKQAYGQSPTEDLLIQFYLQA